jgi:hypothetical protein
MSNPYGNPKDPEDPPKDPENPDPKKPLQPRTLTPEERAAMIQLKDDMTYENAEILRHHDFIITASEHTSIGVVQIRLEECKLIKSRFDNYILLSRKLLMTQNGRDIINKEIDKFRERVWPTLGLFQDHLREHSHASASPVSHLSPKVKYPAIAMPEFDGNLDNWIEFRDRFDSLVNNNKQLCDIDRFNYLLACVKLPAGQTSVLKNFPLSEANYKNAWKAFCERYDDKSKLKSYQFNAMLSMKRMSSETGTELRRIIDDFTTCFSTLDLLGATYEDLKVHVVLYRLDEQTLKDWQRFIGDETQTWVKLREFLIKQWKTVVAVPETKRSSSGTSSPKSFASSSVMQVSCSLCSEQHWLFQCPKFRSFSVNDRMSTVNSHQLCRNCFSPSHIASMCRSTNRCKPCNLPHHTLLHYDKRSYTPPANIVDSSDCQATSSVNQTVLNAASASFEPALQNRGVPTPGTSSNFCIAPSNLESSKGEFILLTVSVLVLDSSDKWKPCRALLDTGSQCNWISLDFAQQIGLQLIKQQILCKGINGQSSIISQSTSVEFSSLSFDYKRSADFFVTDVIPGIHPQQRIDTTNIHFPSHIKLADPEFHIPGKVHMLFGIGIFVESLLSSSLQLDESLTLKETKFGWIVGRKIHAKSSEKTCFLNVTDTTNLKQNFPFSRLSSPSHKMSRRVEMCAILSSSLLKSSQIIINKTSISLTTHLTADPEKLNRLGDFQNCQEILRTLTAVESSNLSTVCELRFEIRQNLLQNSAFVSFCLEKLIQNLERPRASEKTSENLKIFKTLSISTNDQNSEKLRRIFADSSHQIPPSNRFEPFLENFRNIYSLATVLVSKFPEMLLKTTQFE